MFFDELNITHSPSPIIQEDHYYPYGLTMKGLGKGGNNQFLFNGIERQNELNLGWYLAEFRSYDPALGR